MSEVWVVEEGYYEDRRVIGIAASRQAADRLAEASHPIRDHFFGTDPECLHWQPHDDEGLVCCRGCTMEIWTSAVAD